MLPELILNFKQQNLHKIMCIRKKRIYKRVPYEQKRILYSLVFGNGKTITEAAKLLSMNYPVAKSLINKQRTQSLKKTETNFRKPCQFKLIEPQKQYQYTLIVMLWGLILASKDYIVESLEQSESTIQE